MQATHARLLHSGLQDITSELRQDFWILKGRQTYYSWLSNLPTRGLAHETAHFAPLARERITKARPFDMVRIDFCEPVFLCSHHQAKNYITLFTCTVTRAIHVELVSDMTSATYLLAFQRLTSRRRDPIMLYSDNGQTFRVCACILCVIMYLMLYSMEVHRRACTY